MVPEAAERLWLRVDAIRIRIQRGTLPTAEIDGMRLVLVPRLVTGVTRRADDATSMGPPHHHGDLLDELRPEIVYLRQSLDVEIGVRRRADHLVAGMTDERRTLTRQLEAGVEALTLH
jgi:hypothetical protein